MVKGKGVSEVVSALIVLAIIIAGTAIYVAAASQQVSTSAKAVGEAVRKAQLRQGEALSLTYAYLDGNQLKLYIYNYGKVPVKPWKTYVNGAQSSFTLLDAASGSVISEIMPDQLALLTLQKHGDSPYETIIVTETYNIITWKVAT